MNYFLLLVLSMCLVIIAYFLVRKLNQIDDQVALNFTITDIFLLQCFLIVTGGIVLYKQAETITTKFIYDIIFFFYLFITAWIDYHSKQVYRLINFIANILATAFFLLHTPSIEQICAVFIYGIYLLLCSHRGFFGFGDVGIFLAAALYLSLFSYQELTITLFLVHQVLSSFIFLILHLKKIVFSELKMKQEFAFAPSIAFAAWIIAIYLY